MRRFRIFCILVGLASVSAPTNSHAQLPDTPPADLVVAAANAFHEYDNGNTLDTLLDAGPQLPKNLVFAKTYDPGVHASSSHRKTYPDEHLEGLVRRTSFVGFGIPLKRWTYPTSQEQFTFSIYLVRVTSALTAGPSKIYTGQTIYVVRAAGPLTYKGHTIQAIDPEFKLFHLNEEYLFFGKELAPQLYKVDSEGSLLIKNDQIIESTSHVKHPQLYSHHTRSTLFSEVMAAELEVSRSAKGTGSAKGVK